MISILLAMVITGCDSPEPAKKAPAKPEKLKQGSKKEYPSFTETAIGPDSNIINTSGEKISLLYNSVENYLGRSDSTIGFFTECMICEPVETYNGHLIFGRQLEIFENKAIYNVRKPAASHGAKSITRISSYWDRKTRKFKFDGGKGEIRYDEPSCNDADTYTITLHYHSGDIVINNLLNAQFFEYDMDNNNRKEQYILATRNCTQELAIIKIKQP